MISILDQKNAADLRPGKELYAEVRAGFVASGSSLNQWCQVAQISRQYARMCLLGMANGPAAQRLRAKLITASLRRAA